MHALRYGSDVSATMLRILDDAEQAAARIDWSGGGVVAAATSGDGAMVAQARDEGRRGGGGSDVKRGGGPSSVIDRRAALESSDLAAAPDESTQASSSELIVVDQAGPFTVYEDPATGERVLQVDLNAIVGLSEQQIVAYLNEIGLAGRTGIIFTSLHGQNVLQQNDQFFAREGLSTSAFLAGRYGEDNVGDINDTDDHVAVSVVWNSDTVSPVFAGIVADLIAPSMARFYAALRVANPEGHVVLATHSMGGYLMGQMLLAEDDSGQRIVGPGDIDLAIVVQSGAPTAEDAQAYWDERGMAHPSTAPIGRLHWVYDPDDSALQALAPNNAQGLSSASGDTLTDTRDAADDGWGTNTITTAEYNSDRGGNHGGLNPDDPATKQQFENGLMAHIEDHGLLP